MLDFTIETRIERSVREIFDYVTDPAKLHTWQTNTVSATQIGDGPITKGTRLREVHRMPGGREAESVVEVSELEPDRVFSLHVVEGTPIDGRIELEPADTCTVMRFRVHGQLSGAMRLAEPLLRSGFKRQFRSHCDELKRVLEDNAA